MNFQTLPACNTRITLGTSSAWQNPPGFFSPPANPPAFPEARTNAGSVRATQPAAIRDPSTPNSKPPHFSWEVHLQLNTTCHYLPWGISLASGDEFFTLILSLKTTPIGCFEPPISEICVSQIWWWNPKVGLKSKSLKSPNYKSAGKKSHSFHGQKPKLYNNDGGLRVSTCFMSWNQKIRFPKWPNRRPCFVGGFW